MKRRDALKTIATATSLLVMSSSARAEDKVIATPAPTSAASGLPPLLYSYDALAPVIDAETMKLHHDAHHKAYLDKLTAALNQWSATSTEAKAPLSKILSHLDTVPEIFRQTIRNQGGGHLNHSLFWESMVPPDSQKISPSLESELTKSFGGVAQFQEKFETVGASHFGSGWVWLSMDKDGRLDLASYANQDCPAMSGKTPLLGNDLWEHAYYLSYRNRRAEYLKAWWRVVSWRVVEQRINEARANLK
jgi:Fe-Mn family superoxide dismutase